MAIAVIMTITMGSDMETMKIMAEIGMMIATMRVE